MTELLNKIIALVGEISIGAFASVLILIIVGYFLDIRKFSFWRKLVAYLGNVNIEIKANDRMPRNKTSDHRMPEIRL